MKIFAVLALIITFPLSAIAAPLTDSQSRSLIGVVQSSPETPASAFTDLITAFSNITVLQAESLIAIVQAAPGVSGNAFVNMLIAFTIDPVIPQTIILEQKIDTLTQKVDNLGSVQSPTPQPVTNDIIIPMPVSKAELEVKISEPGELNRTDNHYPFGAYSIYVSKKDIQGIYLKDIEVTLTTEKPYFTSVWGPGDEKVNTTTETKSINGELGYDKKSNSEKWVAYFSYAPLEKGTHTITFTSGELTKVIQVVVE